MEYWSDASKIPCLTLLRPGAQVFKRERATAYNAFLKDGFAKARQQFFHSLIQAEPKQRSLRKPPFEVKSSPSPLIP